MIEETTMKTVLRISMLLNVGLAGGLVLMLPRGPKRVIALAPPVVAQARTQVELANLPLPATSTASVEPFRWSQLEAKDYHLYVKNLRNIGCPEPTLEAIVTADVQAAYVIRINELEKKISDLGASSWTNQFAAAGTETALKSELRQIPDEEVAMINNMLGLQPAPAQPVADLASNDRRPGAETPAALPLILQNVDPVALGLNSGQIQVVNELRQNLLNEMGDPNLDPNDPANLGRLQHAQPEADAMLRGMLGSSVYQNYQLAAGNSQRPAAANP